MQQTVDILHKKLEQLGAVKQGSFCVDCETYHATGNTGNIQVSAFSLIVIFNLIVLMYCLRTYGYLCYIRVILSLLRRVRGTFLQFSIGAYKIQIFKKNI